MKSGTPSQSIEYRFRCNRYIIYRNSLSITSSLSSSTDYIVGVTWVQYLQIQVQGPHLYSLLLCIHVVREVRPDLAIKGLSGINKIEDGCTQP